MSTIFQGLNLSGDATLRDLGPVTVDWDQPAAPSVKAGVMQWNLRISDSSGTAKFTLWKAAAGLDLVKGGTYIFSGNIRKNEFKGNVSLQSDNVTARKTDESSGAHASGGTQHAAQGSDQINHVALAAQMLDFCVEVEEGAKNRGFSKEVVDHLTMHAPEYAALWWFGVRSLKMADQNPVEQESGQPY